MQQEFQRWLADERLRLALSSARTVAWEYDPATGAVVVSDNAAEVFGLPAGTTLDHSEQGFALVHPEDLQRHRAAVTQAVEECGSYVSLFRMIRPTDGAVIWLEERAQCMGDASGETERLVGVVLDVTERKRAEEASRQNEERFRGMFEQALAGIAESDLTGRFVKVNLRYCEIVGRTAEELSGLRMQDITHPDDLPRNLDLFGAMLEGNGQPFVIEKRYVRPDGSEVWVRNSVSAVRDRQGEPKHIVAVSIDITENKRAEAALRESEERYRLVADAANDAIWDWDLATNEVMWNEGVQRVFGYGAEQVGLDAAWWLEHIHPDDRDRVVHDIHSAIDGGQEHWSDEYRFQRRDGSYAYVFDRGRVVRDNFGKPVRMVGSMLDLTERKQAEERLRESQAALEFALDAAQIGDWDLDLINDKSRRSLRHDLCFGYSEPVAEWGFETFIRHVHPDDQANIEQQFRAAIEELRDWHFECRVVWPDGSTHWIAAYGSIYRTIEGRATRMLGIIADITERKRGEQERQRLASIVENSSDFVGVSDVHGNPIYLNPAGRKMVGLSADHDVGQTLIPEYFVPEERKYVEEVVLSAILAEGQWRGELTFQNFRTGAAIPVFYDLFRVDDPETGQPINFATVTRDITERKRSEQQIRRGAELLEKIVDRSPTGFYIVDADFHISHINADSQARAFRNVQPAIGRRLDDAMRVLWPEPLATEIISIFRRTLDTGEPYKSPGLESPRADVQWTETYEWQLERITMPDGRYAVVCYYYDTTALRQAELNLRESEESLTRQAAALRDADRRKDEFLATLAHELRNPLAPLRNGLQVMQMAGDDRETVEQVGAMMQRQLNQMVRLVDDLLDVSRISRGKMELRTERIELATVVDSAVETSRPLIDAGGHELTVSIPSEPIWVDADATRLAQVFANLLNNAAKFSEPGGRITLEVAREQSTGDSGQRTVEVGNNDHHGDSSLPSPGPCSPSPGHIVVRVKDEGRGIPSEMLSTIFDMFTRVDRSLERSQGGLGIGLTLVKRLVEMHGGCIEARSDGRGQGSEFIVRLPLAGAPESRQRPAEPLATAAPARRVLVVDDNHDSAKSLSMLLKLMRHHTRMAHDGLDALQAADEFRPDLVLLDIGLPKLNGRDVARQIRQEPWGQSMKLVALTGWGQEEDRQKSHEAGFDAHLVKPVDYQALTTLLDALHVEGRG